MPTPQTELEVSGAGEGWRLRIGVLRDVARGMRIPRLRVEIIDLIGSLVDGDGEAVAFEGGYYRSGENHVVLLQRTLDPDEAGRTLWHELAHAWQTEHLFDGDSELLAASSDEDDTFELIARLMEDRHDEMPLIHETEE